MNINISSKKLQGNGVFYEFVRFLKKNEIKLNLIEANIYCDFPIYKDIDDDILIAQMLIVSRKHGILLFHVSDIVKLLEFEKTLELTIQTLDNLYSTLYARLLRNNELKTGRKDLKFDVESFLFPPILESKPEVNHNLLGDTKLLLNYDALEDYFNTYIKEDIQKDVFEELIATIEGSRGLIRTRLRPDTKKNSKGESVNELEKEIAKFDEYQKSAFSTSVTGISRIRGLAGSGKTVVLAMKAALIHLQYPEARIAYTFYTKSLYQHVKRLITRFYRQFDDRDPDWDKLDVIHAWGSQNTAGMYYNICTLNDIPVLTFSEASSKSTRSKAFDYACNNFLEEIKEPIDCYDYIFIDEGQDFPSSFFKLCISVTTEKRVVWAYDDLQTIFQVKAPSPSDIFGVDSSGQPILDFEEDIVLQKCYRNPREIILVAHAIGFGIYSGKIVQMIDNKEYWQDIGYIVESGDLKYNNDVKICRPDYNSLKSISEKYNKEQIIRTAYFNNFNEEIEDVCKCIKNDIAEGLFPQDILVISVDDRFATAYLNAVKNKLFEYGISSNNIHSDKYGIKDFQIENCVTLSTVHKAKGNEAYSVYIVGVDSLFAFKPSIRERNILFTAMTRTKGWLKISGIGIPVKKCIKEIDVAIKNFPYLTFKYPSEEDVKIMKREIKESSIRRNKAKKAVDEALSEMSFEELENYIAQLKSKQ